jgi:putative oxidoreductase
MNRRFVRRPEEIAPYLLSAIRIAVGLLFLQHGAEKLWGFAGGRIDRNFASLHGFAGPLEVVGGTFIALGLFTRTTAFILCGEMAVAYFRSWAPRGFFPIQNGGEEAVLFCYVYLWLFTAGAGLWSLDRLIEKNRSAQSSIKTKIASWEGYGRSLLRIIVAFTFSLHGLRLAFGLFPAHAGRRFAMPMALDRLTPVVGYWEIVGGVLLLFGLLTRSAAIVSCIVAIAAYIYGAAPHGVWPIRNGGNETLLYACVFLYIGATGAGIWSLDRVAEKLRAGRKVEAVPVKLKAASSKLADSGGD